MSKNLSIISIKTTHARHVLIDAVSLLLNQTPILMIGLALLVYGVTILIDFIWIELQNTSIAFAQLLFLFA